jgi:hypothetical protein
VCYSQLVSRQIAPLQELRFARPLNCHDFIQQRIAAGRGLAGPLTMSRRLPLALFRLLLTKWVQAPFKLLDRIQKPLFHGKQTHDSRHISLCDHFRLSSSELTKLAEQFVLRIDQFGKDIRVHIFFFRKTDPIRLARIGEPDGALTRTSPHSLQTPSSLPGLVNEIATGEI